MASVPPSATDVAGDVVLQRGGLIVVRAGRERAAVYIMPTSGKFVRIVPLLAFGCILIYKMVILQKEIIAEALAHQHYLPFLSCGFVGLGMLLVTGIIAFLTYLLLPRSLEINSRYCICRSCLILRRVIPRDLITSVDLATYNVRGVWQSFCSLGLRRREPRVFVCNTTQRAASSADALTAGRELATCLTQLLDKPLKRHEDIGLRWFRRPD